MTDWRAVSEQRQAASPVLQALLERRVRIAQVWASALAARGEVAAVAAAAKARRVTNERIFANVCWSKLSWAVKL
jgi:hypothetical protein